VLLVGVDRESDLDEAILERAFLVMTALKVLRRSANSMNATFSLTIVLIMMICPNFWKTL
jgi:hypothetical protein